MENKINELQNDIAKLKSIQRELELREVLDKVLTEDCEKMIENRFFEEEFGCWVQSDSERNKSFPYKIYKHYDEKIPEYKNAEYFFAGSKVEKMPELDYSIIQIWQPNETYQMIILDEKTNDKVIYNYIFSNKILNKFDCKQKETYNDIEIYKILYNLHNDYMKLYKVLYNNNMIK